MSETNEGRLPDFPRGEHWRFLLKSAILLALLYVLSATLPSFPPICVGITWALLSGILAIGFLYHATIGKTAKQLVLEGGGWLSKLNSGRIFALVISFVASAVLVAGLVLETPKWGLIEWALAILSIPLFAAISVLVSRLLGGEYAPLVRVSKTAIWASALVGVVLCIAYAIILALQPATSYSNLTQAFLSIEQPYSSSPSAFMSEGGMLVALVDGATAYGMSEAAKVSVTGYIAWKVALIASAFFGISSMEGFCSLDWAELKKALQPLGAENGHDGERPLVKRYVAVAAILPVLVASAFVIADVKASDAVTSDEYTAVKTYLRDKLGIAVYVYDGHMYEWASVQGLIDEAEHEMTALGKEAQETLVPLINEYYDARVANVDSYLDWYYSLPADYERLASLVTGSAEEFMEEQFTARIEAGLDDSELTAALEAYYNRYEALNAEIDERLSQYEIIDVPEWLLVPKELPETSVLSEGFAPSNQFIDGYARFGASAVAGIATGMLVKKLVKKAVSGQFFKRMVDVVGKIIASKGAGTAVGATIGTIGGPLGTALGAAGGLAASVGIDYGFLKIDEYLNRVNVRAEIVGAIEEERAELLALAA